MPHYWLIDNYLVLTIALAFLALVLGYLWWGLRRRDLAIAAGVVLALLLVLLLLVLLSRAGWVTTDRQRIRGTLEGMAAAVEEGKPEVIVDHLADDFQFQQVLTKKNARKLVPQTIRENYVARVSVYSFDIQKLARSDQGGTAEVVFWARVNFTNGESIPFRCKAEMTRAGGVWRMKSFELWDPVTNNPLHVPMH